MIGKICKEFQQCKFFQQFFLFWYRDGIFNHGDEGNVDYETYKRFIIEE